MNTERVIIRESALPDIRRSGGRLRASCPIHGSDHQRSLSIEETGDYAGFGRCFACGAEVLVEDMNPDAARRLEALGTRLTTPERLMRPIKRPASAEGTPKQQQERAALEVLEPRMRAALLASARARAYLAGRGISLELAEAQGLLYLPPVAARLPETRLLQKWIDRLIFPLSSPAGRGYAGRSLHLWHPGMDENEHKARLAALETQEQQAAEAAHQRGEYLPVLHRRWEKTFPAGWYGLADLAPDCEQVILVEGPFDRLALIAAWGNVFARDIVALVGSRDSRAGDWLPARVQRALIALDGDENGKEAAEALAERLPEQGITCTICIPPADGLGKDWSERLRIAGPAGLAPVLEALSAPVQEQTQPAPLPWHSAWNELFIREQVYAMAEALGYPAWEQIAAGDWRGWYALKEQGEAVQVAAAYEALRTHFERHAPASLESEERVSGEQAAEAPDLHPLVDGRRACFGEEEAATCDECGRPFLAEEAAYSIYNGAPICPRCKQVQDAER